jgi:hypothetical protein
MKSLLGRALADIKDDKEEIMLQLDEMQSQIRLLDHKMNLLARKIVGIDLEAVATPPTQVHEEAGSSNT